MVAHMYIILFAFDRDGIFTLVDGEGLRELNVHPDIITKRSAFDIAHNWPHITEHIKQALNGSSGMTMIEISDYIFEIHYTSQIAYDGSITGVFGVAVNVTTWAKLQDQLDAWQYHFREEQTMNTQSMRHTLLTIVVQLSEIHHQIDMLTRSGIQMGPFANEVLCDYASVLCAIRSTTHNVIDRLHTMISTVKPVILSQIGITPREEEVFFLLATGKTNLEISTILHISEKTVEKHVKSVYTKLGVSSRTQATAWAVREGFV